MAFPYSNKLCPIAGNTINLTYVANSTVNTVSSRISNLAEFILLSIINNLKYIHHDRARI